MIYSEEVGFAGLFLYDAVAFAFSSRPFIGMVEQIGTPVIIWRGELLQMSLASGSSSRFRKSSKTSQQI